MAQIVDFDKEWQKIEAAIAKDSVHRSAREHAAVSTEELLTLKDVVPGLFSWVERRLKRLVREVLDEWARGEVLPPPRELLSAEELAKQLKVPKSWVEEKARRGEIPHVKAGRWRRFDPVEVKRALTVGGQASPSGGKPWQ